MRILARLSISAPARPSGKKHRTLLHPPPLTRRYRLGIPTALLIPTELLDQGPSLSLHQVPRGKRPLSAHPARQKPSVLLVHRLPAGYWEHPAVAVPLAGALASTLAVAPGSLPPVPTSSKEMPVPSPQPLLCASARHSGSASSH